MFKILYIPSDPSSGNPGEEEGADDGSSISFFSSGGGNVVDETDRDVELVVLDDVSLPGVTLPRIDGASGRSLRDRCCCCIGVRLAHNRLVVVAGVEE